MNREQMLAEWIRCETELISGGDKYWWVSRGKKLVKYADELRSTLDSGKTSATP